MPLLMEIEKICTLDKLWLDKEVGETDIQRAVISHDITKTPEFEEI